MNSQYTYLEKQLDSLKTASEPKKDDLDKLEELKKLIHEEEKEINRLTLGSKQLKEKVNVVSSVLLVTYNIEFYSLKLLEISYRLNIRKVMNFDS